MTVFWIELSATGYKTDPGITYCDRGGARSFDGAERLVARANIKSDPFEGSRDFVVHCSLVALGARDARRRRDSKALCKIAVRVVPIEYLHPADADEIDVAVAAEPPIPILGAVPGVAVDVVSVDTDIEPDALVVANLPNQRVARVALSVGWPNRSVADELSIDVAGRSHVWCEDNAQVRTAHYL